MVTAQAETVQCPLHEHAVSMYRRVYSLMFPSHLI